MKNQKTEYRMNRKKIKPITKALKLENTKEEGVA